MKYVIDAYAWIEYLIGSKAGEKVKAIVENEKNEIFTSSLTIAELISKIKRERKNSDVVYSCIVTLSRIYPITAELSKLAGELHAQLRKRIKDFRLADSFVLATAKVLKAKIVSGDEHFKNLKNVIFIKA